MSSDLKESLSIMQKYKPDYVIIERDALSSGNSYLIYAYWTIDIGSNPEAAKKAQSFFGMANGCDRQSPDVVRCSNLSSISTEQYLKVPITWQLFPSDVLNGTTPVWYYRTGQGDAIFILGKSLNESTLAKIWFGEPKTMQYFSEAYSNGALRIFKVNPALFSLDLDSIDFTPTSPVAIPTPEEILETIEANPDGKTVADDGNDTSSEEVVDSNETSNPETA